MKVCACLLLFGILNYTYSYTPKINSKSVNLALETVLQFNVKDKPSDIKILDDIQNVITEIRTVIDKNNDIETFYRRNARGEPLTDFIQDAINILNTYEGTAFEDFFHILYDEIRKYRYKGCKFFELMEDHEFEKLITTALDSMIGIKPTNVKKSMMNALSGVLKYENYDNNVRSFVTYINSLYIQAGDKFRKILSNVKNYGKLKSRSHSNLVKIIKNGLRSIIFDHYTNLNMITRKKLKRKIETLWETIKNDHNLKMSKVANLKIHRAKNSKNTNKTKNLESDSININKKKTVEKTMLNRTKTKQSEHKNKITKKKHMKDEKNRYNSIKKETIAESFEDQEQESKQSSQNSDLDVQQWTEINNRGETESDSLSAPLSSIELKKSANVANIPDRIDTQNVMPKIPINNTSQKKAIWIEQSTGRLPKAVLDKLANKTSGSNPSFRSKNLNKKGPMHKKKKWRGKYEKADKTRKKGNEPEKTHETIYDPKNLKTLRYSELMRAKTNEKIYQRENDQLYKKIYEPEKDKAKGNMYGKIHKSKRPKKRWFEFDYASKEDIKYKNEKNLKPNKPTNIKDNDRDNGKTQEKGLEPDHAETHREINEPEQDKIHENTLDEKNETKYALKKFKYDSEEDEKYKPSKNLKSSIVKHKYKDLFSQYDGRSTKYLITKKHNEIQQHKETDGILRVELKHDNLWTRPTTEVLMITESRKTIKNLAKKNADTKKLSTFTRPPRLQIDDKERMKSTQRTPTLSNSSIGWLHLQVPLKEYSKSNYKWPNKDDRNTRTEYSSPLDEGNIIIDDNRFNAQVTSFMFSKDFNVNKRSKNLVTQSNEAIGKANDNTDEVNHFKHRFEIKSNIKEPKQTKAMSTSDGTLRKDTSKMAEIADNETNFLIDYVPGKDSKFNDYNVVRDTTPESMFKSGAKMIPVRYKIKGKLNIAETHEDEHAKVHEDKHVENKIENSKKTQNGFEMITIDKMGRLNLTGAPQNETDTLIEHAVGKSFQSYGNKIEKAEKFKTRFKSNSKNKLKVAQNKLTIAGTEGNKIKPIIENDSIKEKFSTSNNIEDSLKKGIMSETRFRSNSNKIYKDMTNKTKVPATADNITEHKIKQTEDKHSTTNIENEKETKTNLISETNMARKDFNGKTEQTNTKTAVIKTDLIEKGNKLKGKEGIVVKNQEIFRVDNQTSVIQKVAKRKDQIQKDTKQQDIDCVTFKATYRYKNYQKDQESPSDQVASKYTTTQSKNDKYSKSSLITGPESTTNGGFTSSMVKDVLKIAKFNPTVKENKNKMVDRLVDVNGITAVNVSQAHLEEKKNRQR